MDWTEKKFRSAETWAEVRRAWEAGETGASLARRYDVGLDNLWRRRASEGWRRDRPPEQRPEPPEGWNRHAQKAMEAFELRLAEARALAETLAAAMSGRPPERAPVWHLGFVLAWRAERLGPEAAARDRAWAARHGWTAAFWSEHGWLHDVEQLDLITVQANRAAWREEVGLPDGVAEDWP